MRKYQPAKPRHRPGNRGKLLERYNLSETSEDIKGIAFERFLGRTFRGEIGQFFTPRTIVEFMVRHAGPAGRRRDLRPGERVGRLPDPLFRDRAPADLADADRQYQEFKAEEVADKKLSRTSRPICCGASTRTASRRLITTRMVRASGASQPLYLRHRRQRPHGPYQQNEHDHARRRPRRRASPRWLHQRQWHL